MVAFPGRGEIKKNSVGRDLNRCPISGRDLGIGGGVPKIAHGPKVLACFDTVEQCIGVLLKLRKSDRVRVAILPTVPIGWR
jgi:hypothetical protein